MFVCPGCSTRYRIAKAPQSGRIKCPRCGMVSTVPPEAISGDSSASTHAPAIAVEIPNGVEIAGHRILEFLGGTDQIALYKASQLSMGRSVTFHALRKELAGDPAAKSKFLSDARAMARLNHPNLIAVFDMGEEAGICFFTTEFIEAVPLPDYLASETKLSSAQRLALATQAARGLAYAEAAGVTQFWLTPRDILVPSRGDIRLNNIGVSQPASGEQPAAVLDVLGRITYLIAAGKDAPAEARTLPLAKDALGNQLNSLVLDLVNGGAAAFPKAADFAAKLDELLATVQRQKTITTAAAPGGIISPHVEKAKISQTPIVPIVIAAGVGVLVLGAILFWILGNRRQALARQQLRTTAALAETKPYEAMGLLREIKNRYEGDDLGDEARRKLIATEQRIIVSEFEKILVGLGSKIPDLANSIQNVDQTEARLLKEFGPDGPYGDPDPDLNSEIAAFISKQADVCKKNLRSRYEGTATAEYSGDLKKKIDGYYQSLRFADIVRTMNEYKARWPGSENAAKLCEQETEQARKLAKEVFDKAIKDADAFIAKRGTSDQKLSLVEKLEKIKQNYGASDGMDKYVKEADAKLKQLQDL